ncbi:polysaccharide deacetylase family protein [Natronococcus sp. JC468]|nr:polysaccharide deacetylase family protein [Natronococcus sp. JC468]
MVVFTYDDSPLEDYTLTYEVHREYGVPGCTAACPGYMEERDTSLDPGQLREMQDDGWGVLSHTYRHRALGHIELTEPAREGDDRLYVQANRHGAIADDPLVVFDEGTETTATVAGRGSDSVGQYVELAEPIAETVGQSGYVRYPGSFMREILEKTDARLESWGLEVTGFVYPYGRYDGLAEEIVRDHYDAVANHRYGGGHNDLEGLDPTAMRRMYVETDKATEDDVDAFMRTAADEEVLAIVGGHSQYDTLTEDRIRYTIEAALERDLAIVTMGEALTVLEHLDG